MKKKVSTLVTVSLRLDEPDKEKLEILCKENDSTKSEYLRKQVLTILKNVDYEFER
jgi:predicted DNA-binding protein